MRSLILVALIQWSKHPAPVIESITNNRESQQAFDAVYILMPTSANIERIVRDFSGGRQQYAGAHLFFIDGPPPLVLWISATILTPLQYSLGGGTLPATHVLARRTISSRPAGPLHQLLGWVRSVLCKCARHSPESMALAIEAHAFSLRVPEHFFSVYSPPRSDSTARAERDRAQEGIRFAAKCVRIDRCLSKPSLPCSCSPADRECVYLTQRVSVYQILYPRKSRAPRCTAPARDYPPRGTPHERELAAVADEPCARRASTPGRGSGSGGALARPSVRSSGSAGRVQARQPRLPGTFVDFL